MRNTRWLSPAGLITSWALVAFTVLIATPVAAVANDDLGLSVTVVSTANEEGLTEGNDSLWFGVEPGDEITRVIEIESASELDQAVSVELFDYAFENGARFTDFSEASTVSDWFGFAGEQVLLPAGETIEVELSFTIPREAEQISYEGTARIAATAAQPIEDASEGEGFRAVVGGRAAIDIPFWLGIGDALSLMPEFNIQSIQGVLIDDTKYLRVFIENTGAIPLQLKGSAQFADPVFEERVFDPFVFRVPQIGIDASGYADVDIDQSITEGRWDVLVAANQGAVRQTKLFEIDITFNEPGSGPNWGALVIQIIAFIGFLALAIVGYRLIRTPSRIDSPKAKTRRPSPIAKGLVALAQAIEQRGSSAQREQIEKPIESQEKAFQTKTSSTTKQAPRTKSASTSKTGQTAKRQAQKKPAPAKKPATQTKASSKSTSSKKPAARKPSTDKTPAARRSQANTQVAPKKTSSTKTSSTKKSSSKPAPKNKQK